MANKRIRKKWTKQEREQYYDKHTAYNVALRTLAHEVAIPERIRQMLRQDEQRSRNLITVNRYNLPMNYRQARHYKETLKVLKDWSYDIKQAKSMLGIKQNEKITQDQYKALMYERTMKESDLADQVKTMAEYFNQELVQGRKIDAVQLKQLTELAGELGLTKRELQMLNDPNLLFEMMNAVDYDALIAFEEQAIEDMDNATKYAMIKKYNEMREKGMAPSISSIENYEQANWVREFAPDYEIEAALRVAEKKRTELLEKSNLANYIAEHGTYKVGTGKNSIILF